MKKHEISKLVAGVAFGIMFAMSLILQTLGKAWYFVSLAILIGALAGITLYNYRIITDCVKNALRFTKRKLIIKVRIRKGDFWPLLIHSTLVIAFLAALIYSDPNSKYGLSAQITATFVCYLFLALMVSCFALLLIEDGENALKSKQIKKIESLALKVFEGEKYNPNESRTSYHLKCVIKIVWQWYRFAPYIFIIALLSVLTLLAIFLQGIVSVFFFIGFLFKLLSQNKRAIQITLAVTIGTLAGVWQESYFIGLGAGLFFLGLDLMSKYVEINPKILFKKKYNLAGRILRYI